MKNKNIHQKFVKGGLFFYLLHNLLYLMSSSIGYILLSFLTNIENYPKFYYFSFGIIGVGIILLVLYLKHHIQKINIWILLTGILLTEVLYPTVNRYHHSKIGEVWTSLGSDNFQDMAELYAVSSFLPKIMFWGLLVAFVVFLPKEKLSEETLDVLD